jgi:hypothetical protein
MVALRKAVEHKIQYLHGFLISANRERGSEK